jgi:hypothetical protein
MGSVPLIAMEDWKQQQDKPDPLEAYYRIQQLRQQMQTGQLDQQQRQLDIQKSRAGMQAVQTMNEAYQTARTAAPNATPRTGTPGAMPMASPQTTGANASLMATPQATGAAPTPMATPGGVGPAGPAAANATSNSAPLFDRQKVLAYLADRGQGSLIPDVQKTFTEWDKSAGEVQKLRDDHAAAATDYIGGVASTIKAMGYSPEAVGIGLAHVAANGFPQEAEQLRQELAQNPQHVPAFIDAVIARSLKQAEVAKNLAQAGRDTAETGKVPAEISKLTADTAKTTAQMPGGGLYNPSDNQLYSLATNPQTAMTQQGQQAAAVLARKQREKLQLQAQEAGVRIAAENSPAAIQGAVAKKTALDAATGAGVQVYATDRSGRTMLMTKGDAVAQGFGYSKVGTSQISEDRQLNNRLADVTQKIGQYE